MEAEVLKVRDLPVVAVLIMNKCDFIDMERKGNVCWFIFKKKERAEKLQNAYYEGSLEVNAKHFYDTVRDLKGKIFS